MSNARRIDRNSYLKYIFGSLLVATVLIDCNGHFIRPRNVKICPARNTSSYLESFLSAVDCLDTTPFRNKKCKCDRSCKLYGDCCFNCNFKEDFYKDNDLVIQTSCDKVAKIMSVQSCPTNFSDVVMREECEEGRGKNESELVFGSSSGMVFSNRGCALCNGENDSFPVTNRSRMDTRPCTLVPVSNCSYPDMTLWGYSLSTLCATFSNPVATTDQSNRIKIFRNIFCGICNGVPVESLISATRAFQVKMTADVRDLTVRDNIPAAFSILLNFGLDGRERMMYSSENEESMRMYQRRCGEKHIYDPFSGDCRQLFCSSQFTLVNYKCVRNTTSSARNNTMDDNYPSVFDTASLYVEIKLSLQASFVGGPLYVPGKNVSTFEADIRNSIASVYKISPERIQNVSLEVDDDTLLYLLNKTSEYFVNKDKVASMSTFETLEQIAKWNKLFRDKFSLSVQFRLFEASDSKSPEPSTDKIVTQMVALISINMFTLSLNGFQAKVYAINQNIPLVEEWCDRKSGGLKLQYWNEEFHLTVNNSARYNTGIQEVYINVTGKAYTKHQFIANILFQGYDDREEVNISGCVIVCERPHVSDGCERVQLKSGDYEILPDLSIKNLGNVSTGLMLSSFEFGDNGSIYVCYNNTPAEEWAQTKWLLREFNITYNYVQALVSMVLLCISIVALGVVLFTYSIFKELRNLPGCNTLNLGLSVFLSHVLFLLSQREVVTGWLCKALGISVHFFILSSFFWMNVIAFDLYKTFGQRNVLTFVRDKRILLPRYMLYAYGAPAVVVGFSVIQDTYENDFQPEYGISEYCWIGNSRAALAFFAAPMALIIIVNLGFYLRTICSISRVHRKIQEKCKTLTGHKDVILYTRMAAVMGFTWVFGFLAAITERTSETAVVVLTYLFIVFNTSQGILIFFAFAFNKRILNLFIEILDEASRFKIAGCKECKRKLCNCPSIKAFRDSLQKKTSSGMTRTDSTDTTHSILP